MTGQRRLPRSSDMSVDMVRAPERRAQARANEERNRSIYRDRCRYLPLHRCLVVILNPPSSSRRMPDHHQRGFHRHAPRRTVPSAGVFLLHSEQKGRWAFVHCNFVTFWDSSSGLADAVVPLLPDEARTAAITRSISYCANAVPAKASVINKGLPAAFEAARAPSAPAFASFSSSHRLTAQAPLRLHLDES